MTDDRQPGYDFFVSPPVAAPPRPAPENTPPASTQPESTRPVSTPPVSTPLVGTPLVGTPPVSTPPVSTPPVGTPPVSTPPDSTAPAGTAPASNDADPGWALHPNTFSTEDVAWRTPRWASVGITILAVLLVASLAAAVALPMVQRHTLNAKFKHTRISLPKNFNGQTGEDSPTTEVQLRSISTGFATAEARIYGKQTLGLALIVAFRPLSAMSDQDQSDARAELSRLLTEGTNTGLKLDLTPTSNPGRLGGFFGCGKIAPATVCIGTDPGSMVAIVLGPTVRKPQSLALKLREASVTRS